MKSVHGLERRVVILNGKVHKSWKVLEYKAMQCAGNQLMFPNNISPPSSGSRKPV
jgi:hypothetical protein